jgi:hypothetical protein
MRSPPQGRGRQQAEREAEQKFVDQFAEWEKACLHFGVDPAEGAEGRRGGVRQHEGQAEVRAARP